MADIAFILLIFFLVATTISQNQGVKARLPEPCNQPPCIEEINEDFVLPFKINSQGILTKRGQVIVADDIPALVVDFLTNTENYDQLLVDIETHSNSPYASYITTYSSVLEGFNNFRNEKARVEFGMDMKDLSDEDQAYIRQKYGMRLTEKTTKNS